MATETVEIAATGEAGEENLFNIIALEHSQFRNATKEFQIEDWAHLVKLFMETNKNQSYTLKVISTIAEKNAKKHASRKRARTDTTTTASETEAVAAPAVAESSSDALADDAAEHPSRKSTAANNPRVFVRGVLSKLGAVEPEEDSLVPGEVTKIISKYANDHDLKIASKKTDIRVDALLAEVSGLELGQIASLMTIKSAVSKKVFSI
jgi:hypothetical protein